MRVGPPHRAGCRERGSLGLARVHLARVARGAKGLRFRGPRDVADPRPAADVPPREPVVAQLLDDRVAFGLARGAEIVVPRPGPPRRRLRLLRSPYRLPPKPQATSLTCPREPIHWRRGRLAQWARRLDTKVKVQSRADRDGG